MRKLARTIGPALLAVALVAGCGSDGGSDDPGATEDETSAAPSDDASETGAPERDANADLVIWTDSLKLEAVQAVADAVRRGQRHLGRGPGRLHRPADQLRHRQRRQERPRRCRRRARLDRQPGAERRHRAAADLGADDLSGYSPKAVEATTYDGQLYGVPYGIEAIALYRNTEVAPDEPKTFDDAVDVGRGGLKDGKVESALNLPVGDTGDPYHMEPILTSMGGYIFAYDEATGYDASDVGIGKEGSHRAAEKIAELAKQKVLRTSISGDNSIALFTEGKAAFLVSGPWALPDVQKAGFEYAIQPIPGFAGEAPAEPFMGAQAFMVASGAQERRVRAGVRQQRGQQRGGHADAVRQGQARAGHDVGPGGRHRPGSRGLRGRRQRGRPDARDPGDGGGLGPVRQGVLRHRLR